LGHLEHILTQKCPCQILIAGIIEGAGSLQGEIGLQQIQLRLGRRLKPTAGKRKPDNHNGQ
jgi:hypothetical protein